jgi:hypothetical protein
VGIGNAEAEEIRHTFAQHIVEFKERWKLEDV